MQISDQIIAVLDDLCQRFGIVIDWTQESVIPYLEELAGKYIMYEIATSVAWCLVWLSITCILFFVGNLFRKKDIEDFHYPAYIVGAVSAAITFFVVSTQIFDVIECLTIPEKTIIEYVTQLIKPHL